MNPHDCIFCWTYFIIKMNVCTSKEREYLNVNLWKIFLANMFTDI